MRLGRVGESSPLEGENHEDEHHDAEREQLEAEDGAMIDSCCGLGRHRSAECAGGCPRCQGLHPFFTPDPLCFGRDVPTVIEPVARTANIEHLAFAKKLFAILPAPFSC